MDTNLTSNECLRVGITGGIGSGKSFVCAIFESMGIPVYYSDSRAKALMIENPNIVEGMLDIIGADAYRKTGELNREAVGKVLFSQPDKRLKVNALVHPIVRQDASDWHDAQCSSSNPPPYTLQEAAIMVESESAKLMDSIIVVTAPEALRIRRVMERDGISEAAVLARIQSQLSEEERLKKADFVVFNDENSLLLPQIVAIHRELVKNRRE